MNLSEIKKKYIYTTRIELEDGEYVVLREPNQEEIILISQGDSQSDTMKQMEELFPKCLIESSFTTDAGKPASGNELYNELKASGSLFSEILTLWLDSIPFQSRLKKNLK